MPSTRADPLQIVLIRACLYGCGACADFTRQSAALIKTNPTVWARHRWRVGLAGCERAAGRVCCGGGGAARALPSAVRLAAPEAPEGSADVSAHTHTHTYAHTEHNHTEHIQSAYTHTQSTYSTHTHTHPLTHPCPSNRAVLTPLRRSRSKAGAAGDEDDEFTSATGVYPYFGSGAAGGGAPAGSGGVGSSLCLVTAGAVGGVVAHHLLTKL